MKPALQRVSGRCWGYTPYGYQCGNRSTHVVKRGDVLQWACGHHLVQVADTVATESGEITVIVSAIRWQNQEDGS